MTMKHILYRGVVLLAALDLAACRDLTTELPAGTIDPGIYNTPETAEKLRLAAVYESGIAISLAVRDGGMFTDELRTSWYGGPAGSLGLSVDSRADVGTSANEITTVEEPGAGTYTHLQKSRAYTFLGFRALDKFSPAVPAAVRGELYALHAYADLLLGDLYCSGVPLSTVDIEGDYTYEAGSNTTAIYTRTLAIFDSAFVLTRDSTRLQNMTRLGKARALLALGRYDDADSVVAPVPTSFQYNVATQGEVFGWSILWGDYSLVNNEGQNGLPYLSSHDPRIPTPEDNGIGPYGLSLLAPPQGFPVRLANGVEARLIQAEASLRRGDPQWLVQLNALRTDGTFTVSGTDTLWHAGTGAVDSLAPLSDPAAGPLPTGTTALMAGVNLVLRERAFWLYLSGHRQGDLRRIARNDGRNPSTLYPTGIYFKDVYGAAINFPVPKSEIPNPLFRGCLNRDA